MLVLPNQKVAAPVIPLEISFSMDFFLPRKNLLFGQLLPTKESLLTGEKLVNQKIKNL